MVETTFGASYHDRYCAFVDILGFRQLIERLNKDANQFDALRNLLARVHGTGSESSSEESDSDFRAQSISDAVAISTTPTQNGLAEILRALQLLAVDLLVEGYFIRGAVVRAPLSSLRISETLLRQIPACHIKRLP